MCIRKANYRQETSTETAVLLIPTSVSPHLTKMLKFPSSAMKYTCLQPGTKC